MCDTNDQAGHCQSSSAAELLRSAVWSDLAYGGSGGGTLPPVPRLRGASASNAAKGSDTAGAACGGTAGRRATVGAASAAGTAGHDATTAAASAGTAPGRRPFLPGSLAFAQLQAPAAAASSSYVSIACASQHNRCVCLLVTH